MENKGMATISNDQYRRMKHLADMEGITVESWIEHMLDKAEAVSEDPLSVMLACSGGFDEIAFEHLRTRLNKESHFSEDELLELCACVMDAICNSPYDLRKAFDKEFAYIIHYQERAGSNYRSEYTGEEWDIENWIYGNGNSLHDLIKDLFNFINKVSEALEQMGDEKWNEVEFTPEILEVMGWD